MSVLASDIVEGGLKFLGFTAEEAGAAENLVLGLEVLNRYLNGLNNRGCVFETVTLTSGSTVPIPEQEEGDLVFAFALEGQGFWGRELSGQKLLDARDARERFQNAHRLLPTTRADAGLLRMPSQRRCW